LRRADVRVDAVRAAVELRRPDLHQLHERLLERASPHLADERTIAFIAPGMTSP
jgi:hypothetical protein